MAGEVRIVRRGDGTPLIAIHGNGVDHRLLLALDEPLATTGRWERIYLDLPGFGGTTPLDGKGGLPELAQWVLDTVSGIVADRPFALMGNSLGGLLARHVISAFPDQVLGAALLAPVVDPDPSHRVTPERSVLEVDPVLMDELSTQDREGFSEITVRQIRETWEAFRTFALPGIRAADPRAMERLAGRYVLDPMPEAAQAPFTRPVLLVTGRQDHVVGYRDQLDLLDHYPHATYLALDGAGHNVHLEQPEIVTAALRQWVRAMESTIDAA